MGRAPLIVPGPSSLLVPIKDLRAEYTPPDLIDLYSQQFDGNEQVQFWIKGDRDRGPWINSADPLPLEILEGNSYQVRGRKFIAEEAGPAGNIANFDAFNTYFIPHDFKNTSFLGIGTSDAGVDLDALGVSRPVGSLMVIVSQMRSIGNGDAPTAAALQAGYEEVIFPTPLGTAGTQAQHACRAISKVIDGTEATVVPLITSGLAINIRNTYTVMVFTTLGILEVAGTASGQVTTGNPSAKTLTIADLGNSSVLVIACHHSTSSQPTPVLASADRVEPRTDTTTVNVRSNVMYRILKPSTPKANISWDPNDHGENGVMLFGFSCRSDD